MTFLFWGYHAGWEDGDDGGCMGEGRVWGIASIGGLEALRSDVGEEEGESCVDDWDAWWRKRWMEICWDQVEFLG